MLWQGDKRCWLLCFFRLRKPILINHKNYSMSHFLREEFRIYGNQREKS